jgi:hypothetical protein
LHDGYFAKISSTRERDETCEGAGEAAVKRAVVAHDRTQVVFVATDGVLLSSAVLMNRASAWAGHARQIVLDDEIAVPDDRGVTRRAPAG